MVQTHQITAQSQSAGDSEPMTVAATGETTEGGYTAGDEFMATETEEEYDSGPAVVALAGGGFALIWHRVVDSSTGDHATVARYFEADGTPASDEIVLVSGEFLRGPSATPTAEGGFLITRTTEPDPVTGMSSIEVRTYDDAGNRLAPTLVTPGGAFPVAVQLGTGGYAVAWISGNGEIHAQRFTAAGTPSGPDILVGTGFDNEPIGLTATADGGFAVAWTEARNGDDPALVKARFFDSSGASSGPPVTVAGEWFLMENPTIVALADGGYVLGWAEFSGSAGGSFFELTAQPIGADGLAAGPPVILATYKAEPQFGPVPSFAAHPDGGFVAMWPNAEPGPNDTVYHRLTGRHFDSSGAPIGPIFEAEEAAESGDMAVLADGTIATAWYRPDSSGQGVFGRVFRPADAQGGTDGNDVICGSEGADWIDGLAGDDEIHGLGGDDVLLGRSGNDELRGGDGDDLLRGGRGDDYLNGGSGADEMRGGGGHDFYVVDHVGDTVVERADGGWDEIRTSLASFSLVALPDVEGLSAGSNVAHDFRGNGADNFIGGGTGADLFRLHDGGEDMAHGDPGNDVFYFGAALSAGDVVDGGDGRDALVLQGHYSTTLSGANIAGIEAISLQSGANAAFGDTANLRYDYDLATSDSLVAAGVQLIVNAQSLRAGEDFTFDGSAESDGRFLIYGGHGADDLTGGDRADVFFFEGSRWGPSDRVDGGAGSDALVISGGSGVTRIEFGADALTRIESISLNNRFATDPGQKPSYELVLHNGNVAAGGTLIVNGSSIPAGQLANIDGRAVQGGNLILFGGGGHDTLFGGAGADRIIGGGGADSLTGGAGADTFRYDAATDSVAGLSDLIGDFASGSDRFDLSRIDANANAAGNQAFTWIGSAAFHGVAGELRSFEQGGYRWIQGDTDGDGDGDLVIALQPGAPLAATDFLL
ncbi:MAG TPA: calcium-binding protein [Allosphingosinicella sp.]|jgi:Ca2+-binding RTX toxin-like protein